MVTVYLKIATDTSYGVRIFFLKFHDIFQVPTVIHIYAYTEVCSLKPSICILPPACSPHSAFCTSSAFYFQSAVCILPSLCILPLVRPVRSLRFTLTDHNLPRAFICVLWTNVTCIPLTGQNNNTNLYQSSQSKSSNFPLHF